MLFFVKLNIYITDSDWIPAKRKNMCVYIYIYIYRERERETEREKIYNRYVLRKSKGDKK